MVAVVAYGPLRVRFSGSVTADGTPAPGTSPNPTTATATLSGGQTAYAGVSQSYTVTLNAAADRQYTITWLQTGSATLVPSQSTISVGATTATTQATWPVATSGTIDFTISPATNVQGNMITRAGRPINVTVSENVARDYQTSSSQSDVVWTHTFDSPAEITQFLVDQGVEAEGVPLRSVERKGIRWLEQTILGDTLAASYTAGASSLQITDGTYWDSPHIVFPFRVVISTNYPDTIPRKNVLTVSAYNSATKTLTVAHYPFSGTGFESTPQSYPAGSIVGQDTDSWTRPFSALRATENGKLAADPAAAGAVPVRSKLVGNANSVPFDSTPYLWHYGYYAHPDVQARHANWTPYRTVASAQQNLTRRGPVNGADAKYSPFDGSEFWLEWTAELDSRFYLNTSQPNEVTPDSDNKWGMKWFSVDSETSVFHQILTSHSSEDQWSLPGTNKSPFTLSTNKAGTRIGYDDWPTVAPRVYPNDSHQLGGDWHVFPGYARLIANPNPATSGWNTPDGKLAWEMPTDTPVAFSMRIAPGHSQTNDTRIEVGKAELLSGSYAGQWTTIFDASDVRINYGNSDAQSLSDSTNLYPDSAITWPTIPLFDTLPGYQAVTLMGFSNIRLGAFPRPMRFSFKRWLARVTLRRAAPPPPKAETLPSYVPAAGAVNSYSVGATLTNAFRSTVAAYYDPREATQAFGFSSSIINPYWGQWGSMVHFGGGHASTNYNGVACLEFGDSTISWKSLIAATPFVGIGTDATTQYNNNRASITMDATFKEVSNYLGVPQTGVPAAPHTYDARDIIGPAHGGAAHGTFIVVARAENSYAGANAVCAAHKVDFDSTSGTYSWERVSNSTYVGLSAEPPYSTRLAAAQNRIYIEAGKANHSPVYFDLATGSYSTASGTGKTVSVGGNGVSLIDVPERQMHLYLGQGGSKLSGNLQIQYRYVRASDTDMSWSSLRTLSTSIPINGNPITATWCPDSQRLLVGCVHGDYDAVYEIEIPARDLNATWTVTRRALSAGAIDWAGKGAGSNGSSGWPYGGYNRRIRCWVIYSPELETGADRIFLYRPEGT